MGNGILGIAVTGLHAAQAGLVTTGHNIANATTVGYTRQEAVQITAFPVRSGSGYIGQGTSVATVRRVYDQFLTLQLQQAQAQSAELNSYYTQISQLDAILGDDSAGLGNALQDFFGAVQGLAANPASTPPRQAVLSAGEALAARFQTLDRKLIDMGAGIDTEIAGSVQNMNSYASQIASLNSAIVLAQGAAGGQPPNDLMDQRDAVLAELNREVRTTVIKQSDGSYNVLIGTGQPLVIGSNAYALAAVPSPSYPGRMELGFTANGATQVIPGADAAGGRIGGLLAFRTETLDRARNALGQIALVLGGTFNAQHNLGLDAGGSWGGDFFRVASPIVQEHLANTGNADITATVSNYNAVTASDYMLSYDGTNYTLKRMTDGTTTTFAGFPTTVDGLTLNLASGTAAAGDDFLIRPAADGAARISVLIGDTAKVAAAAPVQSAAALANAGTGKVSAGTVNGPPPPNPNVLQPVTIRFTSAGTFDVVRTDTAAVIATGVPYTPNADIAYNGWSVKITGAPAAGDTFTIAKSDGIGDGRNALALASLQGANTVGSAASYQTSYASLVSQVGTKARQISVTAKAQDNLEADALNSQQSVSGVNLDEEAAKLMRYQQAYQASAKVIQIANSIFDALMDVTR